MGSGTLLLDRLGVTAAKKWGGLDKRKLQRRKKGGGSYDTYDKEEKRETR